MILRLIMPTKRKFYAVANGFKTGIFRTWADCKTSVHGYPGAKYKSFKTEALATEYLRGFRLHPCLHLQLTTQLPFMKLRMKKKELLARVALPQKIKMAQC